MARGDGAGRQFMRSCAGAVASPAPRSRFPTSSRRATSCVKARATTGSASSSPGSRRTRASGRRRSSARTPRSSSRTGPRACPSSRRGRRT